MRCGIGTSTAAVKHPRARSVQRGSNVSVPGRHMRLTLCYTPHAPGPALQSIPLASIPSSSPPNSPPQPSRNSCSLSLHSAKPPPPPRPRPPCAFPRCSPRLGLGYSSLVRLPVDVMLIGVFVDPHRGLCGSRFPAHLVTGCVGASTWCQTLHHIVHTAASDHSSET